MHSVNFGAVPGDALILLKLSHMFDEHIEKKFGVERPGACLRMELHCEVGQVMVYEALVRLVVLVLEERLPLGVRRQRLHIERVAVILARNEAARTGARESTGLVVAAISIPVLIVNTRRT